MSSPSQQEIQSTDEVPSGETPTDDVSQPSPSAPEDTTQPPTPNPSSREDITFVQFNQDNTSLTVCTTTGFRLYSIGPTHLDTLEPIYTWPADSPQQQQQERRQDQERGKGPPAAANPANTAPDDGSVVPDPVLIVERLFSSSLLAKVTKAEPRELKVSHFKKGTEICRFSYPNAILSVKLNRGRLVVCLEDSLYVHNIRDMKILHTIKDTPVNAKGLCALSVNSDRCYLAYPASSERGDVSIFDAMNLASKHAVLAAHTNHLAALAFSPNGKLLATASELGTVVKVFDAEAGHVVNTLRRGMMRSASVKCLSFCPESTLLALTSDTATVHIFRALDAQHTDEPTQAPDEPPSSAFSLTGMASSLLQTTSSYLPEAVNHTLSMQRSIATVTINSTNGVGPQANTVEEHTVALANIGRVLRVLLASKEGYLYIYNMPDANSGPECSLVKQHHLDANCMERTFPDQPLTQQNPVMAVPAARNTAL